MASESPRLVGIQEQFERAELFLSEAESLVDPVARFRHLMAAVYFARAIVELLLEAAVREDVQVARAKLGERLAQILPRYHLIEEIRIHDFHRFGVVPRDGTFVGGPIKAKLPAVKGAATGIKVTPEGLITSSSGGAQVRLQRPLQYDGDKFLDDETKEYITLDTALKEYLSQVPQAIEEFSRLSRKPETATEELG